jgi:pyruvate formate lyase activating enzyme
VEEIHLLPYHRLGYDKYMGLGREYGMGDLTTPSAEKMERLRQVAEREGLRAILGG